MNKSPHYGKMLPTKGGGRMENEEMNQLEFQYLLRSQKSNYEQLLKMTSDEQLIEQIKIYIQIIDDTLSSNK